VGHVLANYVGCGMLDRGRARASCTQVFGSILRVGVKIGRKMTTILAIKTKLRQLNPAKLARITEGALNSLKARGYDVPFRLVKPRNGKAPLSLPWFVRLELGVVVGSDVVLCRTESTGILDVAEVSVLDQRDVDGRPILGDVVSQIKVRREGRSIVITITKEAQVVLGNVLWRYLDFGLTDCPGKVTLKIFETETSACRLTSTLPECLRRWPEPVLDAAAAWRIGFEPFVKAMADAIIPPRYARRDPWNLARVAAVNQVMIETAESQAELRRRKQWSLRI